MAEPGRGLTPDVPVGYVLTSRIRAAIRLLGPGEMTPTAKRMFERICEEADDAER